MREFPSAPDVGFPRTRLVPLRTAQRQAVGDFSEVVEAARRKSIEVNAQKAGIIDAIQGPEQHRVTIGQAIDKYLDFIRAHRKQRTYVTYRYTLDKLLKQSCQRSFVDQVTREDILQFMTDCYKRGLGKRTVYDKLVVVLQLFKRHGKTKLIEPSDWPGRRSDFKKLLSG
jgi:integrase/recombinase XerD